MLAATRPTAVNLRWALRFVADRAGDARTPDEARSNSSPPPGRWSPTSWIAPGGSVNTDCGSSATSPHRKGEVNVLTHCNAGWLACVDYGTATAPVYAAHEAGIPVHVWVDETRPRNQGAALTAFELGEHGVRHTVVADNAGGHLMQHGLVDLVIVGADRVAANGDTANKIGTYLKALAARDTGVPFYVALPSSTIDRSVPDGQRHSDRGAVARRGALPRWARPERPGAGAGRARGKSGAEPGVRRDSGPARHRVHHRGRRLFTRRTARRSRGPMIRDEKGYIQFRCEWERAAPPVGRARRRAGRVAKPPPRVRADRRLSRRDRLREHQRPTTRRRVHRLRYRNG